MFNHYMHWPLYALCRQRRISFSGVWKRASELYMGTDNQRCVEAMAQAIEEAT